MKKKYVIWLIIAILGLGSTLLTSCGSMRSYWGVEGDYDFDDGYYYKHKKHKKHKKPKKHHHHHHDHDD